LILTAPQKASPSSFGWGRTELLLFALMAIWRKDSVDVKMLKPELHLDFLNWNCQQSRSCIYLKSAPELFLSSGEF
jgi:hypothetical protein